MSTEQQLRGDSLRRQLENTRKWAAARGWQIEEKHEFKDIGKSAFKSHHKDGEFGRVLALVEDGSIPPGSYLIVDTMDRLSRENPATALGTLLKIIEKGVIVVTLDDGTEYHQNPDTMSLMWSILKMANANQESVNKSRWLKQAWTTKFKNADREVVTSVVPAWIMPQKSLGPQGRTRVDLLIDAAKAETVRRIFTESGSGFGTYKIVQRLNRDQVPPIGRSATWHLSYVQKILTNRAVLGEFQPYERQGKKRVPVGEPIQNYFPPIVDLSDFVQAQTARQTRRLAKGGRKGASVANLFKGKLRCAACGGAVHYLNKGRPPKGGTYLACDGGRRGLGCTQTYWRYRHFEQAAAYERSVRLLAEKDSIANSAALTEIKRQFAELDDEKQRLTKQIDFIDSTIATASKVSRETRQKRNDLETKRAEIDETRASITFPKIDQPTKWLTEYIPEALRRLEADDQDERERHRVALAQDISSSSIVFYLAFDGPSVFLNNVIFAVDVPLQDELVKRLTDPIDPDSRSPAFAAIAREGSGWLTQPFREDVTQGRFEMPIRLANSQARSVGAEPIFRPRRRVPT